MLRSTAPALSLLFFFLTLLSCGPSSTPREPYAAEYCAYFLTGEVDIVGDDSDTDGAPNSWDHCPNNPADSLDSDRDGIGNRSDPDLDGDGIPNDEDTDRDGDGHENSAEEAAGSDPDDPSSQPNLPRLEFDPGVQNTVARWYRGDFHVHSVHSHDSEEPLANWGPAMQKALLDFSAITDHRNVDAFFDPEWQTVDEVLLLPGMEWGGPGHGNQIGIRSDTVTDWNDPDAVAASWSLARLQGAVQSVNHYGSDPDYWDDLFDARPDLLDVLDVMEVWNSWWPLNGSTNERSIAKWNELLSQGHHIGALGGSDAHAAALTIGYPTTFVYAQTLSIPGILHGLRQGRSYIANAYPYSDGGQFGDYNHAATPTLDFRVDADGDGRSDGMMGDTLPLGPLDFYVTVTQAQGPVQLLRNGEVIATSADHSPGDTVRWTVSDTPTQASFYRVEMRVDDSPGADMLLLSSHIYAE